MYCGMSFICIWKELHTVVSYTKSDFWWWESEKEDFTGNLMCAYKEKVAKAVLYPALHAQNLDIE